MPNCTNAPSAIFWLLSAIAACRCAHSIHRPTKRRRRLLKKLRRNARSKTPRSYQRKAARNLVPGRGAHWPARHEKSGTTSHRARTQPLFSTALDIISPPASPYPATSHLFTSRPTHPSSTRSKTSGNICAATSSPTRSTKITTISSKKPAKHGCSSPTTRSRSLQSPHANGQRSIFSAVGISPYLPNRRCRWSRRRRRFRARLARRIVEEAEEAGVRLEQEPRVGMLEAGLVGLHRAVERLSLINIS